MFCLPLVRTEGPHQAAQEITEDVSLLLVINIHSAMGHCFILFAAPTVYILFAAPTVYILFAAPT